MSNWIHQIDDLAEFMEFLGFHELTAEEMQDTEYLQSLYTNYKEYKG